MRKRERQKYYETMRSLAPYLNIGWIFLFSILLGLLIGWWLDKKFGTEPWFMLAGLILGVVTGFYNFFKVVLSIK